MNMEDEKRVYEAKKALAGVWGKADIRKSSEPIDKTESYEIDFTSDTSWSALRENAEGSRVFRLTYDKQTHLLWWGQSYFLDPSEMRGSACNRVQWYKAADRNKTRPAFVWKKIKEGDPPPPPRRSAQAPATPVRAQPKSIQQRSQATILTPGLVSSGNAGGAGGGSSATFEKRNQPEVILDTEQVMVIYKPPYWKCELPEKGDKADDPSQQLLPVWLQTRDFGIGKKLFDESFNPALSGTGFGPLAHRIDVETSGPLLIAKTENAQRHLKSQFHKTEVSKRYVCLVHGHMARDSGKVDVPIRTLRTDMRTRSEVSTAGEWAETNFEVIAKYEAAHLRKTDYTSAGGSGYTLVACDIKSGRTHQIRVHMLHLGHPLVSDDKYQAKEEVLLGDRKWCHRLFLHAYRLKFRCTRNIERLIICPLPEDLKRALMSLGAADTEGYQDRDLLFGDTSFQRELIRPPATQWRPGTRVLRKMVEVLSSVPEQIALSRLNSEFPELRAALEGEGLARVDKGWLAKHWDVFQIASPPGGVSESTGEVYVRLRPEHAQGDGCERTDLEKQIEIVRVQYEDLTRQKQRAVAQEDYKKAAELKRTAEVTKKELDSLLNLADEGSGDRGLSRREADRPQKVEGFNANVRDEELFPALPSAPQRSRSVPRLAPQGKSATRSSSVSARPGAALRSASVDASGRRVDENADANVQSPARPDEEEVIDLKTALMHFLAGREQQVAHINEVNNDRQMRSVMAAQKPRVQAVNKAWLKQFPDTFSVLRDADDEMYVLLEKSSQEREREKQENLEKEKQERAEKAAAEEAERAERAEQPKKGVAEKEKKKERTPRLPPEGPQPPPKVPAYHKVVQQTCDDAPPLVYQYRADKREEAPKSGGYLDVWKEKFMAALRQSSDQSCSIEDLLAAVPSFGETMGARKPQESKNLLLVFLEGSPDVFEVEKRGSGPTRQYTVRLRPS